MTPDQGHASSANLSTFTIACDSVNSLHTYMLDVWGNMDHERHPGVVKRLTAFVGFYFYALAAVQQTILISFS